MTFDRMVTLHMTEHAMLLRERRERAQFEADPYLCTGPHRVHWVRSDNPIRTGRCEACRSFVVHTRRGWRQATQQQALRWLRSE